jgi:predicted GNAT family N-acyltransferase
MPAVRPLGRERLDEAVILLLSAFFDRPFYKYIAPDEAERREFLALNFRLRLEQGLETSEIDAAVGDDGGRIAGIAVWAPPVSAPPPDHSLEGHSLEEAFSVFSPGLQERFFRFLRILTTARDQAIAQPYWSLAPIAVLPEKQGRGVASALIRKKLAEIDAVSQPCFLGTQDEVNLAVYARYGFQRVREDPLSPDLNHYTMIRPRINPPASV